MAASSGVSSKGIVARNTQLKAGVTKNFTAKTQIMVNGTSYGEDALNAKLDSFSQPSEAVAAARGALKTAIAEAKTSEVEAKAFDEGVELALKGMYGPKNPILEDFGIALPKTRLPLTAEQQLTKKTKAADTRQLRHTMSPKQKASVKSTSAVTISTTLVPVGSTTAPTGAPTPAPVATPTPVAVAPTPAANAPTPAAAAPGANTPAAELAPQIVHG